MVSRRNSIYFNTGGLEWICRHTGILELSGCCLLGLSFSAHVISRTSRADLRQARPACCIEYRRAAIFRSPFSFGAGQVRILLAFREYHSDGRLLSCFLHSASLLRLHGELARQGIPGERACMRKNGSSGTAPTASSQLRRWAG